MLVGQIYRHRVFGIGFLDIRYLYKTNDRQNDNHIYSDNNKLSHIYDGCVQYYV